MPERVWGQTLPPCLPNDVAQPCPGIVRISQGEPSRWEDPLAEGVSVSAPEQVQYPARRIDCAHARLGLRVRLNVQPLPWHPDHRSLDAQRSSFRINLRPVERKQLADSASQPGQHLHNVDEIVLLRVGRGTQFKYLSKALPTSLNWAPTRNVGTPTDCTPNCR